MWRIALFYWEIKPISKIHRSLLFPICSSTWKQNNWLALKFLILSKWLLLLCLLHVSQSSCISCIFTKPPMFYSFFVLFPIFLCYPPSLYFFSPSNCFMLSIPWFSLYGRIMAYLWKKKNPRGKFTFWQLVMKNRNFAVYQ